jgi:hypothetical protein
MTIRNQQIDVYRSNSATINVTLTADGGLYPTGNVGVEMIWLVAKTVDATEVLLRKQIGDGISIVEPGVIEIVLDAADTDALEPGWYYHELKVIDGDDRSTAMVGPLWVRQCMRTGELRKPASLQASVVTTIPLVAVAP